MEAVPRMPMICLELKEAGEFELGPTVRQVRRSRVQRVTQHWSPPERTSPDMYHTLSSATFKIANMSVVWFKEVFLYKLTEEWVIYYYL